MGQILKDADFPFVEVNQENVATRTLPRHHYEDVVAACPERFNQPNKWSHAVHRLIGRPEFLDILSLQLLVPDAAEQEVISEQFKYFKLWLSLAQPTITDKVRIAVCSWLLSLLLDGKPPLF